jgi:universal stress protein A
MIKVPEKHPMATITRILCPVDFSECSMNAFRYADDFASWVGADLIVLHAFDKPRSYDREGQWIPADESILSKLDAVHSRYSDVVVSRMAHAGTASDVICWAAEYKATQLIIMGTHGHGGIRRVLLGSTAENVFHNARCPVLTIREQKKHLALLPEPKVAPYPAPRFM